MKPEKLTHKDLVEIGYKWALNRCGFAFKELVVISGFGEIPDVIGFNHSGTFVLEAKTSRADFQRDKTKTIRKMPEYGMGDWRFYICEKGMIKIDELPDMWGLIEVNEKGKATTTHNPFGKGNIYSRWKRNQKHKESEQCVMYSALRRLQEKKLLEYVYPEKTI
jgi:hypothetical protein